MNIALTSIGIWLVFFFGWQLREESVKRMLTSWDLGSPIFFLSFGMFAAMEHPSFRERDHIGLMVPSLRVVEDWRKSFGFLWVRVGVRDMGEADMYLYYERIHAMVEARYATMGENSRENETIDRVSKDPQDYPPCGHA